MPTIIRRVSFSNQNQPFVELTDGEKVWSIHPLEGAIAWQFDTRQRFCTGGYNMETGENYACSQGATVDEKYEQCIHCMKATGFNPAFYNATTISEQQLARNTEPHLVYLAYFAPSVLKVGISHAKRGLSRLLEQGARAAIVLMECRSADIARNYEAKIAGMHGIRENVQLSKKAELAKQSFRSEDAEQTLRQIVRDLQTDLGIAFDSEEIQLLDRYYFKTVSTSDLANAITLNEQHAIMGEPIGMIGSILYCDYNDQLVYLPLKKYAGYAISEVTEPLSLGVQQMTFF